ncbi:hypothetical protein MOBT1_002224 [Malassezia obtusa]|uniref:Uncharacterized protein n=1 Tax=Malassezia obtusa TaxID=76774 RepID=A0AAF0DZK5_9BASI|nr:hypothetical protein MOBT1_002224 [Malassezia obtusa]
MPHSNDLRRRLGSPELERSVTSMPVSAKPAKAKRHISFNNRVEQCVALEAPGSAYSDYDEDDDEDDYEEDSDEYSDEEDDADTHSRRSSSSSHEPPASIARLEPTQLKTPHEYMASPSTNMSGFMDSDDESYDDEDARYSVADPVPVTQDLALDQDGYDYYASDEDAVSEEAQTEDRRTASVLGPTPQNTPDGPIPGYARSRYTPAPDGGARASGALVAPPSNFPPIPLSDDYVEENQGGLIAGAVEIINTAWHCAVSFVMSEPYWNPAMLDEPLAEDATPISLDSPRTTVEIPLALPPPLLHARTNPYVDLGAHLRYYGMDAEAHEFAMSQTTCEFVLTAFLTMYAAPGDKSPAQVSRAGETILFQLEHAAHAHGAEVYAQLSAHAARFHVRSGAVSIPLALHLPWGYGTPPNDALPLPPTHFLAVCKQTGVSRPDDACVAEPPCTLVPIHWIVYVLQCAHLPVPTPGVGGVPVLMCPVPFPEHWALLHRWLYTRDASKLLASLLPLGALRAQCTPAKVVTTHAAVDALAALSLATLVRVLLRIRATWHNGRAVGIYADAFWVTLQRAWDLGVCAVVVRMGRMQVARTEVHSA